MSPNSPNFIYDFNGQPLPVKVSHRAKTRIYLRLREGILHVSAPKHVSTAQLRAFLHSNESFIARGLSSATKATTGLPQTLYYLGQALPLTWRSSTDQGPNLIDTEQGCIWLQQSLQARPLAEQKAALKHLYMEAAKNQLLPRLQQLALSLPKQPSRTALSNARGTWGTCKSDGMIRLNWRLIGAPVAVIEYVCVHELCHLVHLNHSPAFWQLVANFAPNLAAAKAWLKQHQQALFCLDA